MRKYLLGGAAAVSALCVLFVSTNEGTVYQAYPDQGGVWTICEGHTDPTIHKGQVASRAQCDAYLTQDLQTAAKTVDTAVVVPLNDPQRTALIDFTFNVGVKAFTHSTMLRKLNTGCYACVATELPKWDIVAGKHNPGVKSRRLREAALFNRKVTS